MAEIFDVFGIDWRLLVIQGVNFGLLLLALWYFLYRPMIRMISRRQELIKEGVENAEAAKKELKTIEEKRDGILNEAARSAEQIVSNARKRAKETEGELVSEARAKRERLLSEAEVEADELRRRALSDSEDEIARLAILTAERILSEKRS